MMRQDSIRRLLFPTLIALLAVGLVGCTSDDPVTPHDETTLTAEDVAHQAGFISFAVAEVLKDFDKALPEIRTMVTPLSGQYTRDAGAGSTRYYTDASQFLSWIPEGFNVAIQVTFDLTVTDGMPDIVAGDGALQSGTLNIVFDVNDVELGAGNAPVAGTMLVSSGNIDATVTFAPNTATVQIGTQSWTVDMSDGTVS